MGGATCAHYTCQVLKTIHPLLRSCAWSRKPMFEALGILWYNIPTLVLREVLLYEYIFYQKYAGLMPSYSKAYQNPEDM